MVSYVVGIWIKPVKNLVVLFLFRFFLLGIGKGSKFHANWVAIQNRLFITASWSFGFFSSEFDKRSIPGDSL